MLPPAASTVRRGAAAAASGSPSPEMLDHAHRGQVGGVAARSDAEWTKDAGCRRDSDAACQQRWITVHSAGTADGVVFQRISRACVSLIGRRFVRFVKIAQTESVQTRTASCCH